MPSTLCWVCATRDLSLSILQLRTRWPNAAVRLSRAARHVADWIGFNFTHTLGVLLLAPLAVWAGPKSKHSPAASISGGTAWTRLLDEPPPGAPRSMMDAQIEEVVTKSLEAMPVSSTHRSTPLMARKTRRLPSCGFGVPARRSHDCERAGVTSLFAAMVVASGVTISSC
jgi:hypothetical protein